MDIINKALFYVGFGIVTIYQSIFPTQAIKVEPQNYIADSLPTPTEVLLPTPTNTVIKPISKVQCKVMGDIFYYNTSEECTYWQKYWRDKYNSSITASNPTTNQYPNYNLNIQQQQINNIVPNNLGKQDFTPDYSNSTKPIPTLPKVKECKYEINNLGRYEEVCK